MRKLDLTDAERAERKREYARRYREKHRTELAAAQRERYARDPQPKKASVEAWRRSNVEKYRAANRESYERRKARYRSEPEKFIARRLLNRAVLRGDVTRKPCFGCGSERSQGHHEDYSKPLDVSWYCRRCHARLHLGLPFDSNK